MIAARKYIAQMDAESGELSNYSRNPSTNNLINGIKAGDTLPATGHPNALAVDTSNKFFDVTVISRGRDGLIVQNARGERIKVSWDSLENEYIDRSGQWYLTLHPGIILE